MTSDAPPPDLSGAPHTETTPLKSRISNAAAGVVILLIFLTPAIGFWWLHGVLREGLERRALIHTQNTLIRYTSHGQWPSDWDQLQPVFRPYEAEFGFATIKELEALVEIDFRFDLQAFLRNPLSSDSPPRLIWLTDRPDTADVLKVNAQLADHLRRRL